MNKKAKSYLFKERMKGMEWASAYAYFNLSTTPENSPFNLTKDYLDLREKYYRPLIVKSMQNRKLPEYKNPYPGSQSLKKPTSLHYNQYFLDQIFNGEFMKIRAEDQSRRIIGEENYKLQAQVFGTDPSFVWALMLYIVYADKFYGSNQLHATKQIRMDTKTTTTLGGIIVGEKLDEGRPFWIDVNLAPLYEKLLLESTLTTHLLSTEPNYLTDLILLGKEMKQLTGKFSSKSPEIVQFYENMMRYKNGEKSIQEEYADNNKLSYDDRFFAPELYDIKIMWSNAPGKWIDKNFADRTVSRKEIAAIALKRMLKTCADLGIAEKDITRALFEGRFNPDLLDLQLAYEGLFTHITVADVSPITLNHLKEIGIMKASDSLPDEMYLQGDFSSKRNEHWNKRFGTVIGLKYVKTIINSSEETVASYDLLLRMLMRLEADNRLHDNFGLPKDWKLRFAEALKIAENAGEITPRSGRRQ